MKMLLVIMSHYTPPRELDNHYFWANFIIRDFPKSCREHYGGKEKLSNKKGFNLDGYAGIDKIKTLRNCVNPHLGLHIFNCMLDSKRTLFDK